MVELTRPLGLEDDDAHTAAALPTATGTLSRDVVWTRCLILATDLEDVVNLGDEAFATAGATPAHRAVDDPR